MSELKPGWRRVKFGELATCVNDRVDDPASAGVERYVGLEHIDPESLTIRRWGSPEDVESTKLRFKPGDIIFGKRRAYQRKLAVADFEGICSAHAMVLRAKPGVVLPEFLPFFMQSDLFMERAVEISVGSLSPTINWKTLADQEFALPPLEEQGRMVDVLNAIRQSLEAYRTGAMSAKDVRKSFLIEQFRPDRGTQFSFPSHWRIDRADQVGDVQLGQQRHPSFETGTNLRPYLRVANIMDGWIDWSDTLTMHFPEDSLQKFELRHGDILLNEGQSTELVGRSAIYWGERPGTCFQKTLIRYRCGTDLVPEFAQAYFQYMLYTGKFARIAVQTTSIAHLTGIRFAAVRIPIPPLTEQIQVVHRIREVEQATRTIQQRLADTRSAAQRFSNELLGAH